MPTGYTHPVAEGEITELKDFAMYCARDFGALISMRDEPMDAEIPEQFEPSTFYKDKLDEAVEKQKKLLAMSPDEAAAEALADFDRQLAARVKATTEMEEERSRYLDMLAKVQAWKPPTKEHKGLKAFMVDQLKQSIEFDCNPHWSREIKLSSGEEYRQQMLKACEASIERYTDEHQEELERVANRNAWLKALRDSL